MPPHDWYTLDTLQINRKLFQLEKAMQYHSVDVCFYAPCSSVMDTLVNP